MGLASDISGVPAGDPRLLRAVLSIQGQILLFVRPLPPSSPSMSTRVVRDTDAVADYGADFSLAALRALASQPH